MMAMNGLVIDITHYKWLGIPAELQRHSGEAEQHSGMKLNAVGAKGPRPFDSRRSVHLPQPRASSEPRTFAQAETRRKINSMPEHRLVSALPLSRTQWRLLSYSRRNW